MKLNETLKNHTQKHVIRYNLYGYFFTGDWLQCMFKKYILAVEDVCCWK